MKKSLIWQIAVIVAFSLAQMGCTPEEITPVGPEDNPQLLATEETNPIPTTLVGTEWKRHYDGWVTAGGTYHIKIDYVLSFETDSTGLRKGHFFETETEPDYDTAIAFTYTYDPVTGLCGYVNSFDNMYTEMLYDAERDAFVVTDGDHFVYYRIR